LESTRFEGRRAVALNLAECVRIRGVVDLAALQWALTQVIDRHIALRTTAGPAPGWTVTGRRHAVDAFTQTGVMPADLYEQHVHESAAVEWRIADLRRLPPSHRDHRLSELWADEAATIFDLGRLPLVRAHLVKYDVDDCFCLLTVPHFAADAASMPIVWRDLFAAYERARAGRREPLARPALDFHTFLEKQRKQFTRGELDVALEYWERTWSAIGDAWLSLADLDFARPGSFSISVEWRCSSLHLDEPSSLRLLQVCRGLRVTPAAVFLAALGVLLARHSTTSIVVAWVPFLNRFHAGGDDLVGWVVNAHAIACAIDRRLSTTDLIQQCRSTLSRAFCYQDASEQLLVQQGRRIHRVPGMLFNFVRRTALPSASDLTIERAPGSIVIPPTPGSGLDFRIVQDGGRFGLHVMHAAGRFETGTVPGLLDEYRRIVTRLVDNLAMPVATLVDSRSQVSVW